TLRRSTLGSLGESARVNVEPALRAGEPLGGHFVQGHVDGVGKVRAVSDEGFELEAPAELLRYCVEKGSVAVEGVSLTIAALGEESFTVSLVPHTRAATTLGELSSGDDVNLEVDVLAKYVERLLA
ncbi:MAG: riboflavin synthase, partial [Gaiellaceae bacterium]